MPGDRRTNDRAANLRRMITVVQQSRACWLKLAQRKRVYFDFVWIETSMAYSRAKKSVPRPSRAPSNGSQVLNGNNRRCFVSCARKKEVQKRGACTGDEAANSYWPVSVRKWVKLDFCLMELLACGLDLACGMCLATAATAIALELLMRMCPSQLPACHYR